MPDLEARQVSKRFGGVRALDRVDFSADAGHVHALLGENGAGKSTFIKVLTGAVAPDAGDVLLFGEALHPGSPREAARAGVAAVFQELSLVPDLTVAENIWFRRERLTPVRTVWGRALIRSMDARMFDACGSSRNFASQLVDPGCATGSCGSAARGRRSDRRRRSG